MSDGGRVREKSVGACRKSQWDATRVLNELARARKKGAFPLSKVRHYWDSVRDELVLSSVAQASPDARFRFGSDGSTPREFTVLLPRGGRGFVRLSMEINL